MSKQEELEKGIDEIHCEGCNLRLNCLQPCSRIIIDRVKIINLLADSGLGFKVGGISDNLARTASDSEGYCADGVGVSWERSGCYFKAFKDAGYVKFIPIERKKQ